MEDISLDEFGEKREFFPGGEIDIMIEARVRDDGKRRSLIDLDAYREMLELHNYILNI